MWCAGGQGHLGYAPSLPFPRAQGYGWLGTTLPSNDENGHSTRPLPRLCHHRRVLRQRTAPGSRDDALCCTSEPDRYPTSLHDDHMCAGGCQGSKRWLSAVQPDACGWCDTRFCKRRGSCPWTLLAWAVWIRQEVPAGTLATIGSTEGTRGNVEAGSNMGRQDFNDEPPRDGSSSQEGSQRTVDDLPRD